MNKRAWTIILALILIACFFFPAFKGGNVSWYDMIFKYHEGGDWKRYIPLLIPVSALILLIGALNNGQYFLGRGLWAWLPLLTVLYILIGQPLIDGAAIGDIFKSIGKGYAVGWWLTIVTSILLAFYSPSR